MTESLSEAQSPLASMQGGERDGTGEEVFIIVPLQSLQVSCHLFVLQQEP